MTRNPFEEMERAFERMGEQLGTLSPASVEGNVLVDVEETDEEYVVTADLPGYDREDIEVTFDEGRLSIAAERETATEEEGENYVRRERRHGAVRRTVRLPGHVDSEGSVATYSNGVLTVTLPKSDANAGTDIPVN